MTRTLSLLDEGQSEEASTLVSAPSLVCSLRGDTQGRETLHNLLPVCVFSDQDEIYLFLFEPILNVLKDAFGDTFVSDGSGATWYLPGSTSRDVADVVQGADLGLDLKLQLLVLDLDISSTCRRQNAELTRSNICSRAHEHEGQRQTKHIETNRSEKLQPAATQRFATIRL